MNRNNKKKIMIKKNSVNFLLISLSLHGALLFSPFQSSEPLFIPKLSSSQQSINTTIKISNIIELNENKEPLKELNLKNKKNSEQVSKEKRVRRTQKSKRQHTAKKQDISLTPKHDGEKLASYGEQLKVFIEQNKSYPRVAIKMRHKGIVKIKLQIFNDGRFGDIRIITPSRFSTLNKASIGLLRKLGRFKPLDGATNSKNFIIPIAYNLKGNSI